MGGGWECLLGSQSQPGPAGALTPSSWSPGPGHTRSLQFCTLVLPLLSPVLPAFPSLGLQALSRPSTPSASRLPAALRSPSPVPVSLLCTDPGEPGGVERSRRGYPSAAGRRAEDITWVSGLAVVGGGARGRCRSLRSRRDLESSSQSQEPSWGWPNPQPVFFSFEMEPPSPDSRATS